MSQGITLYDRVAELVTEHGGVRAAGRALKLDHTYLWRMMRGDPCHPSDETLRKLGLLTTPLFLKARP